MPSRSLPISRAIASTCTKSASIGLRKRRWESGDRLVVGVLVGGDKREDNRIVGRPLQFAAGKHPARVTRGREVPAECSGDRMPLQSCGSCRSSHADRGPRSPPRRSWPDAAPAAILIRRWRHQEAGAAGGGAKIAHGRAETGDRRSEAVPRACTFSSPSRVKFDTLQER
jgi:hypothetical protein